jgi:nitroimidazol reductase NimA-like FMN-containing flavoprotein (pyridoxamine 5'-phosphate oxidase superfamily)
MSEPIFNEKELRFLKYMRVARLASLDDDTIHIVPICPVFDGKVFYMATHAKTRKVRNLRKDNKATLLVDQYSEDWMRHVAAMMTGTVEVIDSGPEFTKAKALLEAKYQQYNELFSIREGESVILCFKPAKRVTWDYIAGEVKEPK